MTQQPPKQPEPGLPKLPEFMMGDQKDKSQPLATVPKNIKVRRWLYFGWLTDAVLNEQKTLALRDWGNVEALEWKRRMLCYAYDEPPSMGGKRLALLEISHTPYKKSTKKLRQSDYFASGLAYAQAQGQKAPDGKTPEQVWEYLKSSDKEYWVVRFRVLQLYAQLAPRRTSIKIQ